MKKPEKEALDAYYAESGSWAHDRHDALRASRRIAWIVAGIAVLVALCEAFALVSLAPLKTVVPYTLMVDRQTGYVQALKPLDAQLVSSDSALTQSFLVQYVIAREGFDYDALQSDYRKVALWSAGSARAAYIASMQASNPDSPIVRYPRSTMIDVAVKSVTSVGPDTAMVRYETKRVDAGGQLRGTQSWVAVIRYAYSGAPMSVADRFVNPLGFQVQRYRTSMEAAPSPAVVQPAPAGQSQAPVMPTSAFPPQGGAVR